MEFFNEDFLKSLGILITGLSVLLTNWLRKRQEEKKGKDLTPAKNTDVKIDTKLAELRVLYNADRVKLFQFHNGGKYFNGDSIKKISLSSFQTKPGISAPDLNMHQNIPISFLPNFLQKMTPDKPHSATIEMVQDPYLKALMVSNGTYQIMAVEIENPQKEVVAILMVTWIAETLVIPANDILMEYAKKIGVDLSFR